MVAVAAVVALQGGVTAGAQTSPQTGPREGDLVRDHGLAAYVPPRGTTVYVEALYTDGIEEFAIAHRPDGQVDLLYVGDKQSDMMATNDGSTGGPAECDDTAWADKDEKWKTTFTWYFNRGTAPSGVTADEAESALRGGTQNITGVNNGCGFADNVDATASYGGNTNAGTGIDDAGKCPATRNELNTVGFGDLPWTSTNKVLAVECTWKTNVDGAYDTTVESDVKFNKVDATWTVTPGSTSCSGKWDIESVMTHERGHTFGLGHVSEELHGYLTMSTKINGTCQKSERSLGKGDKNGLEWKY